MKYVNIRTSILEKNVRCILTLNLIVYANNTLWELGTQHGWWWINFQQALVKSFHFRKIIPTVQTIGKINDPTFHFLSDLDGSFWFMLNRTTAVTFILFIEILLKSLLSIHRFDLCRIYSWFYYNYVSLIANNLISRIPITILYA